VIGKKAVIVPVCNKGTAGYVANYLGQFYSLNTQQEKENSDSKPGQMELA